jgi:hypothetical protein
LVALLRVEIFSKKKYRVTADLCNKYGFQERFFDRIGGWNEESEYGLYLQVNRLESILGAQVYKALFYILTIRYFYIDDEICDALVSHSSLKQQKAEWFERHYPRGD